MGKIKIFPFSFDFQKQVIFPEYILNEGLTKNSRKNS